MEPEQATTEAGYSTEGIAFSSVLDNLANGTDILATLRTVYKYRIFFDLQNGFVRIRCFQQGLCLAEEVLDFLERERTSITDEEYDVWIQDFVALKLMMLDHLNLWEEYLWYFDKVMEVSPSLHIYHSYRYKIIERKYKRLLLGKAVAHLNRHQQDALTDNEISQRMEVTAQWVASQASYRAKQLKEEAQREQETGEGAT